MKKKLAAFVFLILCNFPTFGQSGNLQFFKLPPKSSGVEGIPLLGIILIIVVIVAIILVIYAVFRRKKSKHKSTVCANCGQELNEGLKFCTKCGTKI